MMELPEAVVIARQLDESVRGKRISGVTVGQTPHKLAWFYGDRANYPALLVGRTVGNSAALGGLIEIEAGKTRLLFGEGVALRYHAPGEPRPAKHQLLVDFADGSALSAAVQMYGGLGAFPAGGLDNPYYKVAGVKPSPLTPEFDRAWFDGFAAAPEVGKLSLKALLATEQRIPGLGNGVLQDILFRAGLHPKKKVSTLSAKDRGALFESVKTVLSEMAAHGGRDTERDLFGRPGGYATLLCKNTANKPCPVCGTAINKEAYMGGSIYFCAKCQRL